MACPTTRLLSIILMVVALLAGAVSAPAAVAAPQPIPVDTSPPSS